MKLEGFRPRALERALGIVQRQHKARAGRTMDPHKSDVEWLREQLLSISHDQVEAFALGLTEPRRLRGAVYLLPDPQVSEKAERVIRARPRADMFLLSWRLLRREYPEAAVERVMRFVAGRFGWDQVIAGRRDATRLRVWCDSADSAEGAVRDWEATAVGEHPLPGTWLETLAISRGEAFHSAVVRKALLMMAREPLRRLSATEYLACLVEETIDFRAAAMAHYLNTLGGRKHWNTAILEQFLAWFKRPKPSEMQHKHWAPVSQHARNEFNSWAISREIDRYFKRFRDQKGRADFWRQFADRAVDVKLLCKSGYDEYRALGLEFPTFGVVEFGFVGNAAHLYPVDKFRRVVAGTGTTEAAFKFPQWTLKEGPVDLGDGRIIHQKGWQDVWGHLIRRLLG